MPVLSGDRAVPVAVLIPVGSASVYRDLGFLVAEDRRVIPTAVGLVDRLGCDSKEAPAGAGARGSVVADEVGRSLPAN